MHLRSTPHKPATRESSLPAPEQTSGEPQAGPPVPAPPTWRELVERIQAGESTAMNELYQVFLRGVRFYLCRNLGPQDLDDRIHDTFVIVLQAIRRGELREPDRLMGFVRTVVRRQVAAQIDVAVQTRRDIADIELGLRVADSRRNPEQSAINDERTNLMLDVLASISGRDREILTRFYLYEQTQEQICEEMQLSETQFRLLKSRAKQRFGELGRRKLSNAPPSGVFFLRKASGFGH